MPAEPSPIQEFPYQKPVDIAQMIVRILFAAAITHNTILAFRDPTMLNTSVLIVMLVVLAFAAILHFCKPDQPPTFYISETHAGFGNPHRDRSAVPFHSVTQCIESPSSLQLVHESISVPLGIELRRHDFAIEDWKTLTALLIEKVRSQAPRARVKTLLDPPEGP